MDGHQAALWITRPRFRLCLDAAGGDHDHAVELYVWNAHLSAAMFETLHHVEVLLRNAVDARFTPVDAAAVPRHTWLEDPAILNDAARRRVRETIGRISRERKAPTRGRVVAGLSFGFWRALFDKRYTGLWVSHLHHAFPAGSGDRSEVARLMSNLVPFRNRLAHHETIIGRPIMRHHTAHESAGDDPPPPGRRRARGDEEELYRPWAPVAVTLVDRRNFHLFQALA